jgi:hypothetical protein
MTKWDWLLAAVLSAIYLLACWGMATLVRAAEITLEPPANGFIVVSIKGKFEAEDAGKFRAITFDLPGPVLVAFASKGGRVRTAIDIGRTIRMRGWSTVVRAGDTCSSACAVAWLGGVNRFGWQTSNVGCHAAHNIHEDGRKEVSAVANAWVGAYLNELGFGPDAIEYILSADPAAIKWLKAMDAAKVGIRMHVLKDGEEANAEACRDCSSVQRGTGGLR